MADIIACPKFQFPYIRASWGKVFKRSVIQKLTFPEDIYIGEDACFLLNLLCQLNKIENVKICHDNWYYYRIINTSAVRRYKPDLYIQSEKQFNYITDLLEENHLTDNKYIKTALLMLSWEILFNLKRNEKLNPNYKSISKNYDCKRWMSKRSTFLKESKIELKRLTKSQLIFWLCYRFFGSIIMNFLLYIKFDLLKRG